MLELQAFRAARQNHMEASKQQFLQQELQKAAAPPGGLGPNSRGAAAAGGQQQQQQVEFSSSSSSSMSATAAAAAMVCLQEPPIPVMQLRVSGVLPLGVSDRPAGADTSSSGSSSWSPLGVGQHVAVVKVWRPCEAVQGMDEGVVVLASGLSAGSEGRSSTVDGKGRLLELSTSKMTR
jgi:hypothetical protein